MTNTTATAESIRLPHTGLRVPDSRLTVTSLKELATYDGVAFTATLRRHGKIVGTVENGGHGGCTMFRSAYLRSDPKALTEQALTDFAAGCHTESGQPVSVENLLDHLVTEFDWTRKVKKEQGKGNAKLRLMSFIITGDGPVGEAHPHGEGRLLGSAETLDVQEAAKELNRQANPGDHGWWQVWRGGRWVDVTTRPADVPADLYR